jgi:predicted transposase YbfD/YdcC
MELIKESFKDMPDFRVQGRKLHSLLDIIFITICGVICGEEDFVGIRMWAEDRADWLRQHIGMENGIPSDDTLRRVFQFLDYEAFGKCFIDFTQRFCKLSGGEVVSIDGKCLRGSKDNRLGKKGIYMVGAWANGNGLLLGQEKVGDKSNEITAIPKLLDMLVLKGCTVTIDAMGCQTGIAQKIVGAGAGYLLDVKGNQPTLGADIERSFDMLPPASSFETLEKDHGRIEKRTCQVITDLKWIEQKEEWAGLSAIVKITSERTVVVGAATTTDIRYFIAGQPFTAEQMLARARSHWGIENQLHWILDVVFHEDLNRSRRENAAANFSFVQRTALNLIKKEPSKISVKHKRHKANRSDKFLEAILAPKS